VAAGRRRLVTGGGDDDATFTVSQPGRASWQIRLYAGKAVATASWLSGLPANDGLRTRLQQARNSLGGEAGRPVVAAMTVQPEPGSPPLPQARERALLQAVLLAQEPGLVAQAVALSGGR
jgi:hypothetical protein